MASVARQFQFPLGRPGVFMRASFPKLRRSCNGAMLSAALDDQARRIRAGAASVLSPATRLR